MTRQIDESTGKNRPRYYVKYFLLFFIVCKNVSSFFWVQHFNFRIFGSISFSNVIDNWICEKSSEFVEASNFVKNVGIYYYCYCTIASGIIVKIEFSNL